MKRTKADLESARARRTALADLVDLNDTLRLCATHLRRQRAIYNDDDGKKRELNADDWFVLASRFQTVSDKLSVLADFAYSRARLAEGVSDDQTA